MSEHIPNFELQEGVPSKECVEEFFANNKRHTLIIMDDLGHVLGSNADVASYFCAGTHHRDFTLAIMLQQLLFKGVHSKLISYNTSSFILFKQYIDVSQIWNISPSIVPGRILCKYTRTPPIYFSKHTFDTFKIVWISKNRISDDNIYTLKSLF